MCFDERHTTVIAIALCSLVESLLKEGNVGDEPVESEAEIDAQVLIVRHFSALSKRTGSN